MWLGAVLESMERGLQLAASGRQAAVRHVVFVAFDVAPKRVARERKKGRVSLEYWLRFVERTSEASAGVRERAPMFQR